MLEVRSADCQLSDGRSPKGCDSCQIDRPRGFGMLRCQPPQVKRTKSLATRQHPQCQTERERWVGVASFVSARAGVSSCRGANTSGASTESARTGTFDTCHDGTRAACASAKGVGADGTNAAAQCGVSWG